MATEFRIYDYPGGIAGEDFSVGGGLTGQNGNGNASGQYLFVAFSGVQDTFVHYANNYPLTDQPPIGISQNDPKNAGELAVRCLGRSKITAGTGGMAVGDLIGSDTAGRGVKKRPSQTGANLGDWVLGVCSCAAAVGELGAVELIRAYQV